MSMDWVGKVYWSLWLGLSSVCVVWSVQQAWRWGGCYSRLIRAGFLPTKRTLFYAWLWRQRAQRCGVLKWWILSTVAVLGIHWALLWDSSIIGVKPWVYWLCLLFVPALLIALARIDAQVFILPDPLLVVWAALGACQAVWLGRWSGLWALSSWLLFVAVVWGLRVLLERPRFTHLLGWFFQWLGAGDIKFLWAAFFWLSEGQIVLMWIYTTVFCWMYHGWQQRRFLPRGYGALGPHLVLGWLAAKWGHPAVQYGYFLLV